MSQEKGNLFLKKIKVKSNVLSTAVLIEDTVNKHTNTINQQKLVKNQTGKRQTSWLFTKREGVEFGTIEEQIHLLAARGI